MHDQAHWEQRIAKIIARASQDWINADMPARLASP